MVLYLIDHQSIYTYNQPVVVQPHVLRLCPRSDSGQKLLNFSLHVEPTPQAIAHLTDLDGNLATQLWFDQTTSKLIIKVTSEVETYTANPFNYLLEPWALQLPIDYPSSLLVQLKPYLEPYTNHFSPIIVELAQEILAQVNGNTLSFLATLNQRIYEECEYLMRSDGDSLPPGVTWHQKQGSCRDFVVLFMDTCRAVGLATRFVSGYQEGDPDQEERHLHAWVEVYIPGGGWRGYDPTHGLAVADRHIVLAASALPSYCKSIEGLTRPVVPIIESQKPLVSQMTAKIILDSR